MEMDGGFRLVVFGEVVLRTGYAVDRPGFDMVNYTDAGAPVFCVFVSQASLL